MSKTESFEGCTFRSKMLLCDVLRQTRENDDDDDEAESVA